MCITIGPLVSVNIILDGKTHTLRADAARQLLAQLKAVLGETPPVIEVSGFDPVPYYGPYVTWATTIGDSAAEA